MFCFVGKGCVGGIIVAISGVFFSLCYLDTLDGT